ncbi:histidine kinase [Longimicrobium sp.]|uniref:histidine kinase n=1 Tax=Longimicrobium sp. TaxID=2029185 RepID=UPI002E33479E|nr:histidine kinase [Longimicrobium sp.]HEX6036381.1 histidine kinase [Longimicrobium sp.]
MSNGLGRGGGARRLGRDLLLAAALWMPVGVLGCYSHVTHLRQVEEAVTLRALVPCLAVLLVPVPLMAAIFAASRRWPLGGAGFRARHVLPHLGVLALTYAVLVSTIYVAETMAVQRPELAGFAVMWFPHMLMTYVIGAGVQTATQLRGEVHREQMRALELSRRLMRTEVSALRAGLHPGFFFDTLDALEGLIDRDPGAADALVARLGAFLRYSLDVADTPLVPMEEDLDALRACLDVLALRSGGRLAVSLRAEHEALDGEVPPLLLVPLVDEVARRSAGVPSSLSITARAEDDGVCLELRARPAYTPGPALHALRTRLTHLYGAPGPVGVEPLPDGGLRVRLLIPCAAPAAIP